VDEQSETEFEQAKPWPQTECKDHRELLDLIKLDATDQSTRQPTPAQLKTLHACIKKVTEDLDGFGFNNRDAPP